MAADTIVQLLWVAEGRRVRRGHVRQMMPKVEMGLSSILLLLHVNMDNCSWGGGGSWACWLNRPRPILAPATHLGMQQQNNAVRSHSGLGHH